MTNLKDIRWKQRFENFAKSYLLLEKYSDLETINELERAGIIQIFETTFELAWKVLKDYLDSEGYTVMSPRETIKQAFKMEMISNGTLWLEALNDRNLTSHTYDEDAAIEAVSRIKNKYTPMIGELYALLDKKICTNEEEE